jgi:hypothetical protein
VISALSLCHIIEVRSRALRRSYELIKDEKRQSAGEVGERSQGMERRERGEIVNNPYGLLVNGMSTAA